MTLLWSRHILSNARDASSYMATLSMYLQKHQFCTFVLSPSIQERRQAGMQMCCSLFYLVCSESSISLLCTYSAIFKSY